MAQKTVDRRALLRLALNGGIGAAFALEQLGGVPMLGTLLSELTPRWPAFNPYDAYARMGDMLRGGPSLLAVHRAYAQSESDWSIVQIKVCNNVYIPLCFALGQVDANGKITGPARCGDKIEATSAAIRDKTELIASQPRFSALKMNRWFGDILQNGTTDGAPPAANKSNLIGLEPGDVGAFPDEVAVQVFMHVQKNSLQNNHSILNCKVRVDQPDITLFAEQKGLVKSPLGITCFMMGNRYDRAEGKLDVNAVVGANSEDPIVPSRTVAAYASQIKQFVDGRSYVDRTLDFDRNLTLTLDKLAVKEPSLRKELLQSISKFKTGLAAIDGAAALEGIRQAVNPAMSNLQSVAGNEAGQGASSEFLAQIKYITTVLDLPGQPLRNFSCFLNIADLDTRDMSKAVVDTSGMANLDGNIQAYSYIEGMRQLGMGLNALAQRIKAGKKMVVLVQSEGGRTKDMGDGNVGFALVLGPKGAGMLADQLYANNGVVTGAQDKIAGLEQIGADASAIPWESGVYESNGSMASNVVQTTGDVSVGVIEFLESVTNTDNTRKDLAGANGRYVKLKRG